jgi:hypothetical protein
MTSLRKEQIISHSHTNNEGRITAQEYSVQKEKDKAIPVTGLGGLLNCETLRLSHCLDNRFIVGG